MSLHKILGSRANSGSVVLVVGGDARQGDRRIGDTIVRALASKKFGGNGEHRSLISTIRRGGRIQLVLLLVRWLGHSEAWAITSACRSVGVRYRIVDGGLSAAWSLLDLEVGRG
jgi:hypothetical protein